MADYTSFFLNSTCEVVELELIEISHPSFSQIYRIVRNAAGGVTVTVPGEGSRFFTYYPLRIGKPSNRGDLDQVFSISLGDLGELIPNEIQLARNANTLSTKPTCKYRAYRSDDLTSPMVGPIVMQINELSMTREGASFEATPKVLNDKATGELYTVTRFPTLRGTL